MIEKARKTLYLPIWVTELLDKEGGKYDGPGVVVAAAIYSFCNFKDNQKKEALENYRKTEISKAYDDGVHDAVEHAEVHAGGKPQRSKSPKQSKVVG